MIKQIIDFAAGLFVAMLLLNPVFAQPVVDEGQDLLEKVTQQISAMIQQSPASKALWTISVRNESGEELINLNADMLVRTASNSKLFASAVLLEKLGHDYKFNTVLYGDGELIDSTWVGNLYFSGSGDPSIDGHFYGDNPLFIFDYFVDNLQDMGIKSVRGDLYGNESYFDDIRYPKGWEWDDLSYYYAPELSALSFNRNCVDLTVRATGRPGDKPRISWFPFDTDYVQFINEQYITPANVRFDESYHRVLGTNTILLRSSLPVGYLETESLSITDPAYFFIDTFRKHAWRRGISWDGDLVTDQTERKWSAMDTLVVHESKPLYRLLERVNGESDNFYTEMLMKAMSAYLLKTTGTTEAAIAIMEEYLEDIGIPSEEFNFRDSSGMAGANLATASNISYLLHYMYKSQYNTMWEQTFSIPGRSGTLENRMLDSPLMGNVHGKTGFISGVRSLSGYLNTADGERLIFSIVTNNFTSRVRTVDIVQESILELLYKEF